MAQVDERESGEETSVWKIIQSVAWPQNYLGGGASTILWRLQIQMQYVFHSFFNFLVGGN